MATHTLDAQAGHGSPAKGVGAPPLQGARFFSINASYSIDADSSEREALHNDFRCLFASGLAVLQAETERLNQAQHAALYLFRQASGILDALDFTGGDDQTHQQTAKAQTECTAMSKHPATQAPQNVQRQQVGADAFQHLMLSIQAQGLSSALPEERARLADQVSHWIRAHVVDADAEHARGFIDELASLLSAIADGVVPAFVDRSQTNRTSAGGAYV